MILFHSIRKTKTEMRCGFLELFAFSIIVLWGYWIVDTLIRNRFNIEAKKFWEEATYVNKFHKWGERLAIILYVIFFLVALVYSVGIFHYSFLFFIMIGAFRAFMEWRFERASKRYVLSILFAAFCLIFLIGFIFLLPDSGGVVYTDNGMIRYVYLGTNSENFFVIITQYRGTDAELIIPSYISGLPVWGIDDSAFADTTSLISIEIPNSVVFIDRDAFRGSGLINVTIPNYITFIGQNAFRDNINLSTVYFESKTPPRTVEEGAFLNISPNAKAIIPAEAKNWPSEGTNWYGLIITYSDSDIYAYSSQ